MLALGLAACANSAPVVAPEEPRHNGYTFGSGNRSDPTSSNPAVASVMETTAGDSTATLRSGYTGGSGH